MKIPRTPQEQRLIDKIKNTKKFLKGLEKDLKTATSNNVVTGLRDLKIDALKDLSLLEYIKDGKLC